MRCFRIRCSLLLVVKGNVSKLLPPGPVDRVGKTRVVSIKLRSIGQDLVGKLVQILDDPWKPRDVN